MSNQNLVFVNPPSVAVVICAYTEARWHDLSDALASLERQSVKPNDVVLVIDHNPQLLARVQHELLPRFPFARAIENNEKRGGSGSKNSGVAATTTDWVAFLDDDATAEPDWIQRMIETIETHPDAMGVGGRVLPRWTANPPENAVAPKWFPPEFYWVFGVSYRGMPKKLQVTRNLWANNMIVKREVFLIAGGFRSEIGPVAKRPINCEETELCIRANQRLPDHHFYYNPEVQVHHRVTPERTTFRYFIKRCYSEGLAKALVASFVGAGSALSAESSHVLHDLPMGVLYGFAEVLSGDLNGFAHAASIVAGLAITTAGYVSGRFAGGSDRIYAAREKAQLG
ncbi:MAG: glycosyltransferase family 2 protein [Anaerolineae bacterium]|nr:glycosyltransferase family 2 protein [Anaerolineae bacterium]